MFVDIVILNCVFAAVFFVVADKFELSQKVAYKLISWLKLWLSAA